MEEIKNITYEEVLEMIKDFPVKPRRNNIIISVDVVTVTDELNLERDTFGEVQYVLATGPFNKDIEPGQRVLLDIERMTESHRNDANELVTSVKITPVDVDGRMFAMITDAVVLAIDERVYEDE